MTKARSSIVNVNDTPYYHCIGRCVRRAFICGIDEITGRDYSHRKQWIVDKLAELSNVFLIDVCAYAVMSNHYHVVLKINHEKSNLLTEEDVIERWMILYKGHVLVNRYIKNGCTTDAEIDKAKEVIEQWRERLVDLSWFMRCLNEYISRKANEEDKCTGHFWEGRFKSQALLNEQSLLSCMAYVDLNPVRAGLADSLDESEFTSIEQRIKQDSGFTVQSSGRSKPDRDISDKGIKLADFVGDHPGVTLLPDGNSPDKDVEGIPYRLMDYLELVDWTGRAILPDKKGYIPDKEPEILDKIGFTAEIWLQLVNQFSDHLYSHIGSPEQLKAVCEQTDQKWLAGVRKSRELYVS